MRAEYGTVAQAQAKDRMPFAVPVKHLSHRFHILTQLGTGRIKALYIVDLSLNPYRNAVGTVLCEQFSAEELRLEHTKGHVRKVIFPQITHPDFIDATAVADHHIRCQRTEAPIDCHHVVVEILDKITVLGEEFFLDLLRNIGIVGGKHRLGADHQHWKAIRFFQILCEQEQPGLDTIFKFSSRSR